MMRKIILAAILLYTIQAAAVIRNVPAQYSTIQAAINASQDGDTVLVAQGTYYENINFRGKNITVASTFIINGNRQAILNTIINGSNPSHPDTASCVLIVSGEDSTTVLEGFTLTGGIGTNWTDEHGAGIYVEGGGVLITQSSPIIRNNFIVDNEAIRRLTGTVSAGGGGIRAGDSDAKILNNVIMQNRGLYGGGIVLNYCSGAVIKNNIIVDNTVDQYVVASTFGGGGLWILEDRPGDPRPNIVENNTIIGNKSFGGGGGQAGLGGGMWTGSANVSFINNLVWGNFQASGKQLSGNAVYTYNNVEDGVTGTGNINSMPLLADSSFYLIAGSPGIDAGNPSAVYNDPGTGSTALFPSMGTLRNDIGAYGGPGRNLFTAFSSSGLYTAVSTINFGNILPGNSKTYVLRIYNTGSEDLVINSASTTAPGISLSTLLPITIEPLKGDSLVITWQPAANYILNDSLMLVHNDNFRNNPYKISLAGNSNPIPVFFVNTAQINLDTIDVNTPVVDTSFYVYNNGTGPDSVYVTIDYNGVTPSNALAVSPQAFEIAAADSQLITFTVYPPLINRNTNDLYLPRIVFDSRFSPGTTHFVKQVRFRLKGILTDINDAGTIFKYALAQNYPNPFNPSTKINYEIPEPGKVTLKIYNIIGKEIVTLVDREQESGNHEVEFDASGLSSGVYFYKLNHKGYEMLRKMILLK
jgi:hypothetical protein